MTGEREAGDEQVTLERQPPDDVFSLLGNELRVEILRVLSEVGADGLSFSDLHDRVDIRDSGNFNYHLDKLQGTFIQQTDAYELTYAGEQVIGAIYAGTYTATATVEAIPMESPCLLCDGHMVAEYANETASIRCTDCKKGADIPFPPGTLDQFESRELPSAFARWWHHTVKQIGDKFCPTCSGRLEGLVIRPPSTDEDGPRPSMTEFDCRRCPTRLRVSGAMLATSHPVVEGFFVEHGYDTTNRHPAQFWGELDESTVSVPSEDPLRLEVQFTTDGETVIAEIGPNAGITDVRRFIESS